MKYLRCSNQYIKSALNWHHKIPSNCSEQKSAKWKFPSGVIFFAWIMFSFSWNLYNISCVFFHFVMTPTRNKLIKFRTYWHGQTICSTIFFSNGNCLWTVVLIDANNIILPFSIPNVETFLRPRLLITYVWVCIWV